MFHNHKQYLEVYTMKKDWYKSKAVWGAGIVLVSVVLGAMGFAGVSDAVMTIGVAMGIVGIRTAKADIK